MSLTRKPSVYGLDITCGERGLEPGRISSGRRLVAEAVYRRLTTRRGTVPGSPSFGVSVTRFIGLETTTPNARRVAEELRTEVAKDDRVVHVAAQGYVTTIGVSTLLETRLDVRCADGPFELTVRVGELDLSVLGLEAIA